MSGVAIVAIPSEDDYVWKISSEKVPHMTLLFLGDMTPGPELARIENFLGHVVSTSMTRFGMSVDYRGTLGPDLADVLFFCKSYSKMIEQARTEMLANPDIRQAYLSTQQFPEWTPHLTLGYPATPAKPDDRDYPGLEWINFDKIALWVGDFEGPEFRLEYQEEVTLAMTETLVENILAHHGTKGMKWGVRKDRGHEGEPAKTKTIAKADKKYEKTFKSGLNAYIKVNNTFAGHINPELDKLNSHPKYKDKNLYADKKLYDSYMKDYEKTVDKAARATMEEFGTNASGTRQMKVTRNGFGEQATWQAELVDVKHSNETELTKIKIIPTFNATGHIVSQKVVDPDQPDLQQSATDWDVDGFLAHHGIKGMKWGVRRAERNSSEVTIKTNPSQNKRVKTVGGKGHDVHPDAAVALRGKQKAKASGVHTLSNEELKKTVERMNLEQQLKRLNSPNKTEAHKFVENQLKQVGQQKISTLARK